MYKLKGTVTVTARSSIHDSRAVWDRLTGEANIDGDALEAATASIRVDMTSFDAGDWLKNRRIRNDFELDRNPKATFELSRMTNLKRSGNQFEATAAGTLQWRGVTIPLEVAGTGTLDAQNLSAEATFALDVTQFGVKPPKLLMFKVDDVVTVQIAMTGVAP